MKAELDNVKFFQGKGEVKGLLLKYFQFSISDESLESIGNYQVVDGNLEFDVSDKKSTRVNNVIRESMKNLTCTITKNPAIYIDEHSNTPLIGALEFGIIDRGTNVVEIRPCSGCNLACVYCSVHEGPGGTKKRELVIDKNYLLKEFDKLAQIKEHPIEIFIETQGEPLLYADLPAMIRELKARDDVKQITMVTNGTFFTEQKIIELADAGLDRINWSINSLDKEQAKTIAGAQYDLDRIKKLIMFAKDHIEVLMCPVIMKGMNEDQMEDFVKFAKEVKSTEPIIGFQNFLWYKGGRNPVEEIPMHSFEEEILALEKKYNTRLRLNADDFEIIYDKTLPKPFKKRDIIQVTRLFPGRLNNETFCAADDRIVKVIGRVPDKNNFSVQIIRDKHNIFLAKAT